MLPILNFPSSDSVILLIICFVGGLASTMVGTSGGFTFAAMASVLPVSVVVPVHATVEAVASIMRCFLLRNYVQWRYFFMFVTFGCFGVLLAILFIGKIPDTILKLVLGCFILSVTWMPLGRILGRTAHTSARIGGLVTSFLTVFIGATGPLVAALLSKRYSNHPEVIATHAACMSAQHAAKIVIFVSIGSALWTFAYEIAGMILMTTLGTWLGRFIIISAYKTLMMQALKAAVTLLGIHLVGQSLVELSLHRVSL